jgi:hypothetical protein
MKRNHDIACKKELFFQEILNFNRILKHEHFKLNRLEFYSKELADNLVSFLFKYAQFNAISSQDVAGKYLKFVSIYSKHLSEYRMTNKYPFEYKDNLTFDRVEYDLALIMSTLFSPVRYKIMHNLFLYFQKPIKNLALIGIGAGIDLEIITKANPINRKCDAYDINLSPFVAKYFKGSKIIESEFTTQSGGVDTVLAIELLEHLDDPFAFSKMVYDSLNSQGRFLCTTAADMPQFDHLYNFKNDKEFESRMVEIGFEIITKESLYHNYIKGPKQARNTWYNFVKI